MGNPSRGDDALGPLCLEALQGTLAGPLARGEVELLLEFQLQVEHIYDLVGRARVCFVDASVRAAPPFEWGPLLPTEDRPTTSHALSPGALLACHRRLLGPPPPAWLMAIRGERFELGEEPSEAARAHLARAVEHLGRWCVGLPALSSGRPPAP